MSLVTSTKFSLLSPVVLILVPLTAYAKPVGEAVSVVTDSETMDPNGVKLMVMCISLLVFLAFTLIGVTIFYFTQAKKKDQSSSNEGPANDPTKDATGATSDATNEPGNGQ
jgi:cytochrome c biogenesis protein CcdA